MAVLRWLREEFRTVLLAALYFAAFFFIVLLLKQLLLEGYGIAFTGLSTALLLALVTAKVVVVLDKAPLRHRVGVIEVVVRAALYTAASLALLLVEKAFSSRQAAGGFVEALRHVFEHPDMPEIWATVLCLALAFVGYVAFAVARRELGAAALAAAFLGTPGPRRAAATRAD